MSTGRYAPSPSGRMHLGNLMCCLLAWLSAKSKGGQVLLRIEDLDTQRCPRSYADAIVDDLAWLGLAADGPTPPVYQSDRSEIYQRYFDELSRRGLVYPCFCSRSQLHAASAPHRSDGQVIYAGTCRGLTPAEIAERSKTRAPAWRVQVPDEVIAFEDGHMGHYEENLARDCGDFFLRRADGVFAYQLAVVVDDALMGVDEVVRGSDLLSSTPRQLWLYRELGLTPPPETAAVVKRVIHTTADFDYAKNLRFTPGAVEAAVKALHAGAFIVTDTNMALAGITKPGLKKLNGEAICYMADPAVAEAAKQAGTTRAVAAMHRAAREHPGAILAIGNAPTALLTIAEEMEAGLRPALVIGVPVGFVNVVESKETLFSACAANGVPAIAAMGRKGGSTVAAAVCNALVYSAAEMLDPAARGWK